MIHRYQIQNHRDGSDWNPVPSEEYRHRDTAMSRARALAQRDFMDARVWDLRLHEAVVTYGPDGEIKPDIEATCIRATREVSLMPKWKQGVLGGPVMEHHISPNGYEVGTFRHAAEAWLLSKGLIIPDVDEHPLIYQGMLDEFLETVDFAKWEAGE